MSHNDFILKTLNLKDKNVYFKENYLEETILKGKRSLIYHAYLTYISEYCPSCSSVMNSNIVKHGFKLSKIKLPNVSRLNAYLYLNKQRYNCRHCNKTFTCTFDEINFGCCISNNTKFSITLDLTEKSSGKDIANRNNVSINTVERIMDSHYDSFKLYKHYLPKNICFDEFKFVKSADGNMNFNMCDALTSKTIDIVENRQLDYLTKYFLRYSKDARDNVENIVIDMYSPYISLIKNMFPNVSIIIDKFHIINMISRALNKTRIMIMKHDKKNYNKMKRYWKLLLKSRDELNSSKWLKFKCFDHLMTEYDVVNYIVNQNVELKTTYDLYQSILYSIENKDIKLFDKIISESYENISEYMQTSLNTLNEFKFYFN